MQQNQDHNKTATFEESMTELENLVRRLEDGRLPLEEAITAYERGITLKRYCEEKLNAAKMRVDKIVVQQAKSTSNSSAESGSQIAVTTIPFDIPESLTTGSYG